MIEPRGPFTLLSAARFIAGWPPTRRPAAPEDGEASVRLGFLVDDWSDQAGVILRQTRAHEPVSGTIVAGTRAGADRIRDQAARIVSLDHDGTGYGELGRDDTVVERLQEASGWLRPVLFHSPYEAACWAVISSRIRQAVAARVRDELSAEHGGRISVEGEELLTFPPPERLLEARAVRGLSEEKLRRLHGIAAAALAGQLDRDRLLEASPEEALAGLRRLPGIGPFWSEGILLRAVGTTDALALGEREGRRRAGEHYGLPEVVDDDAAFVALAERWRPFRTWVSVLLRAAG